MRKRSLLETASRAEIDERFAHLTHGGSQKHKAASHLFGLPAAGFPPPDATLCDRDASFAPADMNRIPSLLDRARRAGLVGNLIWAIDDNGWVYELQLTNSGRSQYHGYPLRASDPFTDKLFRFFEAWAMREGTDSDRRAAEACRNRYGLRA
jgi:hypothetical protein